MHFLCLLKVVQLKYKNKKSTIWIKTPNTRETNKSASPFDTSLRQSSITGLMRLSCFLKTIQFKYENNRVTNLKQNTTYPKKHAYASPFWRQLETFHLQLYFWCVFFFLSGLVQLRPLYSLDSDKSRSKTIIQYIYTPQKQINNLTL